MPWRWIIDVDIMDNQIRSRNKFTKSKRDEDTYYYNEDNFVARMLEWLNATGLRKMSNVYSPTK